MWTKLKFVLQLRLSLIIMQKYRHLLNQRPKKWSSYIPSNSWVKFKGLLNKLHLAKVVLVKSCDSAPPHYLFNMLKRKYEGLTSLSH